MAKNPLPVWLEHNGNRVLVGELRYLQNEGSQFEVARSYIDLGAGRPLLSAAWLEIGSEERTVDRLRLTTDKLGSPRRLPDWFSGLLPEGALRDLVTAEMGTGNFGEYEVIERLGQDLPGAVYVGEDDGPPAEQALGRIRFSLAGVQLKFVGEIGAEGRVTFPAAGQGGHYIVKTPSTKYSDFVEAEHLAMSLSKAVGINVAETWLLPKSEVDGIPSQYLEGGENVLVSRRFDRADGHRTHMEDFAQIAGAPGDLKYTRGNYHVVLRFVERFSTNPEDDADEVVRRTVNDILVGNGDAHLKNWSFVYDQGTRRLSPAYDILPYRAYGDPELAIPIAGAKNIDAVPLPRFLRILSNNRQVQVAKDTVEQALDLWPAIVKDSTLADTRGKAIVDRLMTLKFAQEIRDHSAHSHPEAAA